MDLRHDVVKILSRIARVLKDVRGCAAAIPLLVALPTLSFAISLWSTCDQRISETCSHTSCTCKLCMNELQLLSPPTLEAILEASRASFETPPITSDVAVVPKAEYNPCEFVFAQIKCYMRNHTQHNVSVYDRLWEAIRSVSWDNVYSDYVAVHSNCTRDRCKERTSGATSRHQEGTKKTKSKKGAVRRYRVSGSKQAREEGAIPHQWTSRNTVQESEKKCRTGDKLKVEAPNMRV